MLVGALTQLAPHDHERISRTRIKDRAAALESLGFDKVGIVPAEPLSPERARLEEWLRRGYHGEMSWMARDADSAQTHAK